MAVDRGALDAQLKEIGEGERWWEQREFRDLPHILQADETLRGLVNGRLLGAHRPRLRPTTGWLIVATSHRLICLRQERFARRQVEVPAGQILRIHQSNRLRSFQITLETPLRSYRIRVRKADAFRFTRTLAPLMAQSHEQLAPGDEPLMLGDGSGGGRAGIAGMVSRFGKGPTPEFAGKGQVERLETTVEALQRDVERLQQQVGFLEDLLQKQAAGMLPTAAEAYGAERS